jgi:BA14K-like protein
MRRLISAICAATLFASANAVPARAVPPIAPPPIEVNDLVVQAKYKCRDCSRSRSSHRRGHSSRKYYGNNHHYKKNYNKHYNKKYYAKRRHKNYNYHSNNRYWDDDDDYWWGVPGVFLGAAILGSTLYASNNSHVGWCYKRYRSYRASDNTFQPYHGPRRRCVSPYGR